MYIHMDSIWKWVYTVNDCQNYEEIFMLFQDNADVENAFDAWTHSSGTL